MGKKDLGMALQYTYQRNPMKENTTNLVYPNGDSLFSGSWSNHYLMAGPVFMKTIKKLLVDVKVLGGLIVSASPSFDTPNPTDTTMNGYSENIASGFGYQISAGIGYNISSHITIKFNLGLLGGWPGKERQYGSQLIGYMDYKDPVTGLEYKKPVYSAPVEYDIQKVVTTINPSFGLIFRF
jgi:hypothetical protein